MARHIVEILLWPGNDTVLSFSELKSLWNSEEFTINARLTKPTYLSSLRSIQLGNKIQIFTMKKYPQNRRQPPMRCCSY